MQRMSAAEYRRQFVTPAREKAGDDESFLAHIKAIDAKEQKKQQKKSAELQTEQSIQTAILARLSYLKDGFFWRQNSGLIQQQDKYGNTRVWRAGIPGISDIIGVYRGRFVAIEVKRPGKKPTLEQEQFMQQVRNSGGIAFVCTDDSLVIATLQASL